MKSEILELDGHILDSLTLAKVIDKIQLAGMDYMINDLRIGRRKGDVSRAQLTVYSDDEEGLQLLVQELRTYGAIPQFKGSVELAEVEHEGTLPHGAYIRHIPPMEVNLEGKWLHVDGLEATVVVDGSGAFLRAVSQLKVGDKVVMGNRGVRAVILE